MSALFRVTLAMPPEYVDALREQGGQPRLLADVRARAARLGFSPTLLETQDATDNRIVALLARRNGGPLAEGDGTIRIQRIEPVEEPAPGSEKADPRTHLFDPGLSVAEVGMVSHALKHEYNPRHLWGLAACMAPDFPVAASLLRARKVLVERLPSAEPLSSVYGPPCDPQAIAEKLEKVRASALREGIPLDLVPEEVRRVAFGLAAGDPEESHPAVVDLARCLVREIMQGVFVVDRAALLRACPPTGEEGVTSSSAIQFAIATCKPQMSRVRSIGQVAARKTSLETPPSKSDKPNALRSQSAMMRAQKAVERHRWLEWYQRNLSA